METDRPISSQYNEIIAHPHDDSLEHGMVSFGPLLSTESASVDQIAYRNENAQIFLKMTRRIVSNIFAGAVGGWFLEWATAYVLSDIHYITIFAIYFASCYLIVCLLFLLLASSGSSPISLRTLLAGIGLITSVMCLLLQKSIRHFFQTRKLGLHWSSLLRDLLAYVVGGVISATCLLSGWACVLMATKCCIRDGLSWPSGAQVLCASFVAFVIGSVTGLEFGYELTAYPRMKPGGIVTVMWRSLAWQALGVSVGMLGMIFVRELVPRWHLRAPIDADMESLAIEFGPSAIMQLIFARASAPVASIFGRVQPRLDSNDAELHFLQTTS